MRLVCGSIPARKLSVTPSAVGTRVVGLATRGAVSTHVRRAVVVSGVTDGLRWEGMCLQAVRKAAARPATGAAAGAVAYLGSPSRGVSSAVGGGLSSMRTAWRAKTAEGSPEGASSRSFWGTPT